MRVFPAADQAVLLYMGEEISLAAHQRVRRLLQFLLRHPPKWLRNLQPAYSSLMVTFDASLADHAAVEAALRECAARAENLPLPKPLLIEIPVCYGGAFGPDLPGVSGLHSLRESEVVALHTSQTYHAYFLGFVPGFAYLGDLPESIATPRLDVPRMSVPAGSVAIAGRQTAVYPFSTPGGWRLIGRTPLTMFRAAPKPLPTVSMGDLVRFRAITRQEFLDWKPA